MKRQLFVLSMIGAFAMMANAQAETSVTLYGFLDTGYGYKKSEISQPGVNYTEISSGLHDSYLGGSNFGFRGVEDLGNGLRAGFVLESGIGLRDGSLVGVLFHRESHLDLSSDDWGTLQLGRNYNLSDTFFHVNSTTSMGDVDKTFGAASVRVDNMFRYLTPNFSGFQGGIGYAAEGAVIRNDQDPTANKDRGDYFSLGAQYTDDKIHGVITYDRVGSDAAHAATAWAAFGSYDFGFAQFTLGYGQDQYAKINGVGAFNPNAIFDQVLASAGQTASGYDQYLMQHDFKASNYYVGANIPLAGGTVGLAWARTASNLDDADKLGPQAEDQNIYSARYVYPLSKRTNVYAYGSYGTGIAYINGLKSTEAGLGMSHNF